VFRCSTHSSAAPSQTNRVPITAGLERR
jgi:hypothetical protein